MSLASLHSRSSQDQDFRILGIRMVPLTIGHLRHLESEQVDPVRTPADLATAILICSRPAASWQRLRKSWLLPLWMVIWGRRIGVWDFRDKLELWSDYVRWNTELPLFTGRGEARESILPSYRLTRVRMLRLGYAASEIDSTTYLDAMWDLMAASELDGYGDAKDGTEADLDAEIAQTDIEAIKAQAAKQLADELRAN